MSKMSDDELWALEHILKTKYDPQESFTMNVADLLPILTELRAARAARAKIKAALEKVATCKDDYGSVLKTLGNIAHDALAELERAEGEV